MAFGCKINEQLTNQLVKITLKHRLPYNIKFIFPQAPIIYFDYDKEVKPAWYNIISLEDLENGENDRSLSSSISWVDELISREISQGISSRNILIVGFSQGGSLALATAVSSQYELGGFIGLGSFLPYPKFLKRIEKGKNKQTPMLMCHGQEDKVVFYEMAQKSFQVLDQSGYQIEFEDYPWNPRMGHEWYDFVPMIINGIDFCERIFRTRNLPEGNVRIVKVEFKYN